jgi:hypothetical protein
MAAINKSIRQCHQPRISTRNLIQPTAAGTAAALCGSLSVLRSTPNGPGVLYARPTSSVPQRR